MSQTTDLIDRLIDIRDFKTGNGFDLDEVEVKLIADEIERLRRLIEMAYYEGIHDVTSRMATADNAASLWETADVKQCVLDQNAEAELFAPADI